GAADPQAGPLLVGPGPGPGRRARTARRLRCGGAAGHVPAHLHRLADRAGAGPRPRRSAAMNDPGRSWNGLRASLTVSRDDFVLRNHHVHGVPVLPGVVLVDVVWRALLRTGCPSSAIRMRDVLFHV